MTETLAKVPTVEERLAAAERTIDVLLGAVDMLGHGHIFDDMAPVAREVIEQWAALRLGPTISRSHG